MRLRRPSPQRLGGLPPLPPPPPPLAPPISRRPSKGRGRAPSYSTAASGPYESEGPAPLEDEYEDVEEEEFGAASLPAAADEQESLSAEEEESSSEVAKLFQSTALWWTRRVADLARQAAGLFQHSVAHYLGATNNRPPTIRQRSWRSGEMEERPRGQLFVNPFSRLLPNDDAVPILAAIQPFMSGIYWGVNEVELTFSMNYPVVNAGLLAQLRADCLLGRLYVRLWTIDVFHTAFYSSRSARSSVEFLPFALPCREVLAQLPEWRPSWVEASPPPPDPFEASPPPPAPLEASHARTQAELRPVGAPREKFKALRHTPWRRENVPEDRPPPAPQRAHSAKAEANAPRYQLPQRQKSTPGVTGGPRDDVKFDPQKKTAKPRKKKRLHSSGQTTQPPLFQAARKSKSPRIDTLEATRPAGASKSAAALQSTDSSGNGAGGAKTYARLQRRGAPAFGWAPSAYGPADDSAKFLAPVDESMPPPSGSAPEFEACPWLPPHSSPPSASEYPQPLHVQQLQKIFEFDTQFRAPLEPQDFQMLGQPKEANHV
eukprot:GHVT01008829.1.p1 GENE.GHVT01008829.1~~GHVT01008829.1.p1  ORF type:complete len:545 (+),score=130.66 GHVT01008829.1:581-2215(+)